MNENRLLKNLIKTALFLSIIIFSINASYAPIQENSRGYAINGYDPVAYFTKYKAVKGDTDYGYEYKNTKWLFSSEKNKLLFIKNPEKYVPKYGGYCAYGVKFGMKVRTDPRNFSIVDEKLYLNLNEKIKKRWERKTGYNIAKAERKWHRVKDKKARD